MKRLTLSFEVDPSRPFASSTQKKTLTKRSLKVEAKEQEPNGDTPRTIHRQPLAEAISTAMSKGLEPLLAVNETRNKPTKSRGTRDGNADGWMILMKRCFEKAHAEDTPLNKTWTILEFFESEGRDYITNRSEAEQDTDQKVFALLAHRF